MTLEQLVGLVGAALDERLVVENPPPFGRGVVVRSVEGDFLVTHPSGATFVVTVRDLAEHRP